MRLWMIKTRKDLTGSIIGNFLVLNQTDDYISPSGIHRTRWNCKCLLCGNDNVVIMDTVLQKGSKKSCGCLNDLTGQRFGKLTVICKDGQDKNGNVVWKCKCDCGVYISVIHSRLTTLNVLSCGCLRKELASERFSKKNTYDLSGQYGVGWTSNTNHEFYFDLEDYNKIKDYCWCEDINKNGYKSLKARDKTTDKIIKMSYLLGYKGYDHINRNPLDNRKNNFRQATNAENARNRRKQKNNKSGFIGVCWDKNELQWLAYISVNYKKIKLGYFQYKKDAIRARLIAEQKYFGEFAPQRHLFKEYGIEDEFMDGDAN